MYSGEQKHYDHRPQASQSTQALQRTRKHCNWNLEQLKEGTRSIDSYFLLHHVDVQEHVEHPWDVMERQVDPRLHNLHVLCVVPHDNRNYLLFVVALLLVSFIHT